MQEATRSELERVKRSLTPVFELSAEAIRGTSFQPCLAYLNVRNTGDTEAKNARGRLIAITSMRGRREQSLDIPLAWAQPDDPTDLSRKSFYGRARLNVARGGVSANWLVPASAHQLDPIDQRRSEFARDGNLLVGVEVSADNVPPTVGWFRLQWRNTVPLGVKDGVTNVLILDYDDIEVEDVP